VSDPIVRGGRANIEMVASMAGVSVATVSRALRGLPNVAESTRKRVEAAAASLNYRPHPSASRLASGRSREVTIAVPVLNSWYFSEVVAGAEAVLSEAGYSLSVTAVSSSQERIELVKTSVAARSADGLVMVDLPLDDSEVEILSDASISLVTTGFDCGVFPSVVVDNVAIGVKATQHLFDRGHERIGLLGGHSEDPLHFTVPHDRVHGYELCLSGEGGTVDPQMLAKGNFSVAGGHEAMSALLRLPNPPTAVFAISDEMAFGAMWAARDAGLRVPDDLAVIGVDDHELAEMMGLTTIRQFVDQHGVIAARKLVEMLESDDRSCKSTEIDTTLVIRDTT